MREYPITVPTHVYHINSSASNIFDVDQYQRKLLTNDQPLDNNRRFHPSLATVSYPNKNHSNYNCTSNGDLSSASSGYRVLNSTLCGNSATNYNRSNKNAIKRGNNNKNSDRFHDETANGSRATTSAGHGSYSLLDAITNAVTTANCSSTVYPLNEDEDDAAIDNADASKNASSSNRRHYLTDDKLFASNVSRCQAADQLQSIATPNHFQNITPSHISSSDEQFQRYGYSVGNNRAHQFPSVNYKNSYLLWIGTPVAASFAVAIVIASLAGPQWLLTEEKIRNVNYNGTANYQAVDDGMYITKYTKSSLWILCFAQGMDYQCSKIDYFPKDEYSPDPNDSTLAIPYAVIKSTPFFLISGFILVVSYMVLMLAMCSQRHSVLFFFSGIFFIIAGLVMLIGIIMYISLFKSEVGSKLRPRSMFQPPMFTYRYGHSFILFVVGCISAEIVGTLNFFLFIRIREVGREKAIPCFLYARTPKKEPDDDNRLSSVRDEFEKAPHFKCQKHPTVPKAFFSPFTQRRYFFEKPVQKCDIHQKNLAKSLNELYTEPAPNSMFSFDLPQEFPLTRSVSTTTDIFSNCSGGFGTTNSNSHKSLRTFTPQLNKRMNGAQNTPSQQHHQQQTHEITFHSENGNNRNFRSISRDGSRDSLNDISGGGVTKGILTKREKSKDELFSEFCKKAGQRPKPKDIYFIDSQYDNDAERSVFVVENYATIRKNRRNANLNMMTKATNVYNSNQSLKDSNNSNINKKTYPLKSLFDAGSYGGSTDREAAFINNRLDNFLAPSRSSSRDSNLYGSRTLPRDFLKRNIDFDPDPDGFANRRISANGLYTPYNLSMTLPATASTPKRFAPSNDTADEEFYKKSYDTLASRNSRQCDAYTGSEDALSVHWPNAIPGSPSSYSNRFNYAPTYSPHSQRKPAHMSTFYSQHFPRTLKPPTAINKIITFNGTGERNAGDGQARASDNVELDKGNCSNGIDENCTDSVNGSEEFSTFDLDRMEKERRKSHASLFEIEIDFENGTPV